MGETSRFVTMSMVVVIDPENNYVQSSLFLEPDLDKLRRDQIIALLEAITLTQRKLIDIAQIDIGQTVNEEEN